MWIKYGVLVLLIVSITSVAVSADENGQYNRVSISSRQTSGLSNDILNATLAVEMEGENPSALMASVNQSMQWALKQTESFQNLDVSTGNYHVHVLRQKNSHFNNWQASQILHVSGSDLEEVSKVVGLLQDRLQIKSMYFDLSPAVRDEEENNLIIRALDAFKARAMLISRNMGAENYAIVNISVMTNEPGVRPMRLMKVASSMPAVKADKSQLSVTVSGTIELLTN